MKKVVVVTRTKDRLLFLERAIRSIANQTYGDFTHVIVNDGGDREAIEALVGRQDQPIQEKIQLFHRDIASGAPDTIFNESIDRVDSEFFAIHDDDDTWHPDFLKQTVDHLEQDERLGAVVVRTDKVIETIESQHIKEKTRLPWMPDVKAISLYRQCIDNQMTPITTLYRRSAYQAVGKFDDSLPVVGDWEFGVRLLLQFDVDFIDPGFALANYHHRSFNQADKASNTSFAGNDKHRYYTNKVMNRNLRQEIAEGQLGVGYIMSKLRYEQHEKAEMVRRVLPRFVTEKLKKRIQD